MDYFRKVIFLIFLVFQNSTHAECLLTTDKRLPSMGSFFELQIVTECHKKPPEKMFIEVQKDLDSLEADLSLYQSRSPINEFNKTGVWNSLSNDANEILKISIQAGSLTNGAFDITIWPVLKLIQESFEKNKKPPDLAQLDSLKSKVDFKKLMLSQQGLRTMEKGQMISLDGVAKGYAVDSVEKKILSYGYKNYLLNFSGNMKWQGRRHDKKKWKIVRWNPLTLKAEKIPLTEAGAIASSGIEHNQYSDDGLWHHLIDPRELRPSHHWLGTTVQGPKASLCDILSTATFVMQQKEIIETLKHYPEYRVWAISSHGKLFDSKALK